jgi:hypothetical protein
MRHPSSLSRILDYYYEQIPRQRFSTFLENLCRGLRNDFTDYLRPYPHSECFVSNICPKCSKLGFDRFDDRHYCTKCGLSIGFVGDGVIGVGFADKKRQEIRDGK